jgi:hypothetical protein
LLQLFKKFIFIKREKGFIYALIKVVDYLNFLYKKKKIASKINILNEDRITLIAKNSSLNIYWDNKPITSNVGLHSAILNLETWHDSTKADWKIHSFDDKMKISLRFWNLPITQFWTFKLDKNSINWKIEMEVEEYLLIEQIKAGLIILPNYTIWMTKRRGGKFPPISNWEKVWLKNDEKIIFLSEDGPLHVSGIDISSLYLPALIFKINATKFNQEPILQNTDKFINGRFLQTAIASGKEYIPAMYEIFDIKIYIEQDRKKLFQIMELPL